MTTAEPQYPTCPVCGHAARHAEANVRYCYGCKGPCLPPGGREKLYPRAGREK